MVQIRLAHRDDAATLMRVHREAVFAKAAPFYDEAILESWSPGATPERVRRVEQEIVDPHYITLVAEHEGEVLGFATAIPSRNELRALYVKPNTVGCVGQRLLNYIEVLAFDAGAAYLEFDASLNAEAFYRANGYIEIGRADHVSDSGDASAAIQLRKIRPDRRGSA
ncbi:MAG: GNAT family N-acetyltransferase [Methylocystis sp.]